ncbi:catechol 2,3-dioxygenase-like lactoylglutathione lyase family enzyme [Parabacteroides sp. PM5-20]|uniref:VOC family protein n=1 Tax=Parabacteroides sp. 52 TaxID=2302940 RepID=UPI00247DD8FB|nr:catechol 2,3-dioxygenase-like lactoylglutathione lyase family enzyme [Parabacteroides sp. PM5-20]
MEYQTLSPNIGVKSVDETVQFYTETLGFNLIMSVPAPTGNSIESDPLRPIQSDPLKLCFTTRSFL